MKSGLNNLKRNKMENKQTAMQTLWEWIDANYHEDTFNLNDARDMSLELEKQQIIDAHDMGYIDGGNHKKVTAEQYYNETYGGNK